MIKEILIKKTTLHFRSPFAIAYEKVEKTEVIIIKITDDKGNFGLGSAAVDDEIAEITGETINKTLEFLKKKLTKKFFIYEIKDWKKYHEKIQKEFKSFQAAKHATEEAILNLFAQRNKTSLMKLFGGQKRKSSPIIVTIGINSMKNTLKEVSQRLKEGFRIIKLKCGLDLKNDIKKIKSVRKLLPKNVKLTLDANQGYTFEEAKILFKEINNLKISLIEQPTNKKKIGDLKKLKALTKIPIIADEAVITPKDAMKLLKGDYVDGVNIKLMKCGGPINYIEIFNLAKKLNKIVMIGCMYESNISISTGAALALSLKIDYVDLDSGHFDFDDDPAIGGALIARGKIVYNKPLSLRKF